MQHKLETPKQLAKRLGWTVGRVRRLIAKKQIAYHKIGGNIFIKPEAIEEYLKSTEVRPENLAEHNAS